MYKPLAIIFSLLAINVHSQVEKISSFGDHEKREVVQITQELLRALNDEEPVDYHSYLTSKETNIQGEIWLQNSEFIKMFQSLIKGKSFDSKELVAYTFDDILLSPKRTVVSQKLFRVFSDISILVSGKYKDQKDDSIYDINIIFGRFHNSWRITSIHLSDLNLVVKNTPGLEQFTVESIDEFNISIPVPKSFSDRVVENGMVSFFLEGDTPRDAIIQTISGELKAPIEVMTFKWAEYVAFSRYTTTSISARFHPLGFIYEYIMIDENGNENKGITLGIEDNDSVVFIQFFSFKSTYDEIWQDIDMMIRNIEKINEV
jgi:hypothetical protein